MHYKINSITNKVERGYPKKNNIRWPGMPPVITYKLKKKLFYNAFKINVIAFLAQTELNIYYINRHIIGI